MKECCCIRLAHSLVFQNPCHFVQMSMIQLKSSPDNKAWFNICEGILAMCVGTQRHTFGKSTFIFIVQVQQVFHILRRCDELWYLWRRGIINRVSPWPLSLNMNFWWKRQCLYPTHCYLCLEEEDMEMTIGIYCGAYMSASAAKEDDIYPPLFVVDQV